MPDIIIGIFFMNTLQNKVTTLAHAVLRYSYDNDPIYISAWSGLALINAFTLPFLQCSRQALLPNILLTGHIALLY